MLYHNLKHYTVILATASPRRQQFFRDLGIPYKSIVKPVNEVYPESLKGHHISDYLAHLKAQPFINDIGKNEILITSDTIVWDNDKALGKPESNSEALETLLTLSNATHEVITSVCFTTSRLQKTVYASTKVTLKALTKDEIEYYIQNFKPFDKAGSYGIQEWIGLIGVTHIEGSFYNVMGLPTHLVYETLIEITNSSATVD